MSHPARITVIRRSILDTLKHAQDYAVEASVLRSFVDTLLKPQSTDEEWTSHINWLVKGSYITSVESSLDESLLEYAITARGRTLLATH